MKNTKRLIAASSVTLLLGAISAPASAKDIDMGKLSKDSVKSFCADTQGANYVDAEGIYGCGWDRPTGTHYLLCDKDGCFYSNPAARQQYQGKDPLGDVKAGRLDASQTDVPWVWIGFALVAAIAGFFIGRGARRPA